MLVCEEMGKPDYPDKNLSEQGREPTNLNPHITEPGNRTRATFFVGGECSHHCAIPAPPFTIFIIFIAFLLFWFKLHHVSEDFFSWFKNKTSVVWGRHATRSVPHVAWRAQTAAAIRLVKSSLAWPFPRAVFRQPTKQTAGMAANNCQISRLHTLQLVFNFLVFSWSSSPPHLPKILHC